MLTIRLGNVLVVHEAIIRAGKILPSMRHIFPETTPNLLHPRRESISFTRRTETMVHTTTEGLFMLLIDYRHRKKGPAERRG